MDENTWRFAQLLMWLIGLQTALLAGILGILWSKINSMDDKITDLGNRMAAVETLLHMKECCILKEDKTLKKAK
jgi:hypothetical protein